VPGVESQAEQGHFVSTIKIIFQVTPASQIKSNSIGELLVLRLMGIDCLAYLALRIYNSYNSATTRSNNLKVISDQSQLLVLYVVIIRNFYRILRLLCLELLFFALNN